MMESLNIKIGNRLILWCKLIHALTPDGYYEVFEVIDTEEFEEYEKATK